MAGREKILLDTCAILWLATEDERLTNESLEIIKAAAEEDRLFVSVISLWELGYLEKRGRLDFIPMPHIEFWDRAKEELNLKVINITEPIITQYYLLGDSLHNDPGDRFIASTAIHQKCKLVTSDTKLIAWALETTHPILSLR